ncbi:MAG: ParA family protein [Oscillospiraceae bacterium]|jgi:chromosome partitioning protein|nr:ParA family protein [Oscillospiraceae bacterium]
MGKKGKIIAVSNLKGGVGKTMTAASLGFGLARQGKKALCVDLDPQHSLTVSFGVAEPNKLTASVATVLNALINDDEYDTTTELIRHAEGVDLLPANSTLAGMELALVQIIGRETILRQYLDNARADYDYIILDCSPSMDLLTVNALAAADSVIIPVTPKFLDAKGMELLLRSIAQLRRQINPSLIIEGILLTMADKRSVHSREVISLVENAYGGNIKIFGEHIPRSVRAAECSAQGVSIFARDPNGKVAAAYQSLVGEVLANA